MKPRAAQTVLLGLILGFFSQTGYGQSAIVTDHFSIYFQPGAENTARRVAEVAEEVYAPVVSAFDAFDEVSRVFILVHDETDFSNGYADYSQNKIEIWASDLDFELRGTTNWIKNVLTHELAHIVSLKAAKKGYFSFFVLNFGRYNVNPDYYFALPFYNLNAPSWYAEGIAQFESQENGHDDWDTHRDMLLRMAALENDLLSYDEMGVFTKDGLHSEMIYNQGFALVNYIDQAYGEGKAEKLTEHIGLFSFDKAIHKTLGVKADQLYDDWKTTLTSAYRDVALKRQIQIPPDVQTDLPDSWPSYTRNPDAVEPTSSTAGFLEGRMIIDGGYLDYFPSISPDGNKIAYISNERYEFAVTHLKLYDRETGGVKKLVENVDSRLSWTPDSKRLVYVRRKENFNDLYVYDLAAKKARRISRNLRAKDPAVSPDGKTVAFIRNEDGSMNLGLVRIDGTQIRYLTHYNDGTQLYSPAWSPDGKSIAFSIFRGEDRDIALIDATTPSFTNRAGAPDSAALLDTAAIRVILHSPSDERDPVFLPDGSGFLFSSDWDGIFNLYFYSLSTGIVSRKSSVIGGAFCPTISADGKTVVYAGYHAANYNVYGLSPDALFEPVSWEALPRDYVQIYTGKSLKDLYTIGRAAKRLFLTGATPIISLSPNFVGNRFTINTVNLGMQISIGDLFGEDEFVGTAVAGRALKHADYVDLNYTLSAYYQRKLPSLLTRDKTLAPTGYGFASKRVVNDFDDRSFKLKGSELTDLLVMYPDQSMDTLYDVRIDYDQEIQGGDKSTFDFSYLGAGIDVPLDRRQKAGFQFLHQDYGWLIARDMVFDDRTRFFYQGQELLFQGYPYHEEVKATLFDAQFFKSNEFSFYWQYLKVKPTADAGINPRGARLVYAGYTRMNTTVTDSLIYVENTTPGSAPNIPSLRQFPVNQFVLNWIELIDLPIRRHTLGIETMMIAMDQRIPTYDELRDIDGYFPMRLYLGGLGTVSGYPYFTQNGSKLFVARMKYTFPILGNIGKQILHLYFDRLYGSLFFETGTTWNYKAMTLDALDNTQWLRDVGFELRMSLAHFYRIPGTAYVTMAWPLVAAPERDVARYDQRIYFGLRLGGSY